MRERRKTHPYTASGGSTAPTPADAAGGPRGASAEEEPDVRRRVRAHVPRRVRGVHEEAGRVAARLVDDGPGLGVQLASNIRVGSEAFGPENVALLYGCAPLRLCPMRRFWSGALYPALTT